MHDLIRPFPFPHGSRNERIIGEVVRAMARLGHLSILFRIQETHQVLSFRTMAHTHVTALHITIDRPKGQTALSTVMFGKQVRLQVVAEQRQRASHPEALLDAARAGATPTMTASGVRLEQEHSSVLASILVDVDIDALQTPEDAQTAPLQALMRSTIDTLEAALVAHTLRAAAADAPPT